MYWCVDELGTNFVISEKADDEVEGTGVMMKLREVFMIIPSRGQSVVYMFSEFDFSGNFIYFFKQWI